MRRRETVREVPRPISDEDAYLLFWTALFMADPDRRQMVTSELQKYVASQSPLTQDMRQALADWIGMVAPEPLRTPGNPHAKKDIEIRDAARNVHQAQVRWKEDHNKRSIPDTVTSELIDAEIIEIGSSKGTPIRVGSGSYNNWVRRIRIALKAGRF
jgi:hypothetical protein